MIDAGRREPQQRSKQPLILACCCLYSSARRTRSAHSCISRSRSGKNSVLTEGSLPSPRRGRFDRSSSVEVAATAPGEDVDGGGDPGGGELGPVGGEFGGVESEVACQLRSTGHRMKWVQTTLLLLAAALFVERERELLHSGPRISCASLPLKSGPVQVMLSKICPPPAAAQTLFRVPPSGGARPRPSLGSRASSGTPLAS